MENEGRLSLQPDLFLKESGWYKGDNFAVILAGPSAVGKGSIANGLLTDNSLKLHKVLRSTTRPRGNNENEEDYNFISAEKFIHLIETNSFLEWRTFGEKNPQYYGTSFEAIASQLNQKNNLLFDVDINTGLVLKNRLNERGISVVDFCISPTGPLDLLSGMEDATLILQRRLASRARDNAKDMKDRMQRVKNYLAKANEFTYFVMNGDQKIEKSVAEIQKVIEDHKTQQQPFTIFNYLK